ncbi:MAG: MBL fold metallo-hydrolase, partial [Candidatus Binatia bacterium]
MRIHRFVGLLVTLFIACSPPPPPPAPGESAPDADGFFAPSRATEESQAKTAAALPLADPQDLQDAKRGFLGADADLVVRSADGKPIWDMTAYRFETGDPPASVNPSLWRQAQVNALHGLFEVVDGIYQVRGYDVSNMTWIRGASGWIVVDPLTSEETAAAAAALARKHLG